MSIARNTAHNLVGFLVPSVLALATVPAYLALIGAARYGVLMLAWLLLGFSGLFDLGLARATSQRIAALRGEADAGQQQSTLVTALAANLAIGGVLLALLAPLAGWFLVHGMALEPGLRAEALTSLPLLALAIPVATSIGVLSGALAGREQFAAVNRITVIGSTAFQLLPLMVAALAGPKLSHLVAAGLLARLLALALLWRACRRAFGPLHAGMHDRRLLGALVRFGGWVTLSALAAPVLAFADRVLIGAMLGARAVAVYAIPWDATQRLGGFPGALGSALFPRLAAAADEGEAARLVRRAVAMLYLALTPLVAAGLPLADPLFRLWLGESIGAEAAPLARLLLIALWFGAFAQMAYIHLQARGRPDVVSKLQLAEIPFYLAALWFALLHLGLWGAALAFLLRAIIDGLLLFCLTQRRIPHGALIVPTLLALIAASLALQTLPPLHWPAAAAWALAGLIAALLPCWLILPAGALASLLRETGLDRKDSASSKAEPDAS